MVSQEGPMEVEGRWFDVLVSGEKPVEGRKKSPKWERILVGEEMDLKKKETGEVRRFRVTHINEYENLREYLEKEGIDRCLPGIDSIEEGVEIYRGWSTEAELAMYKFLAIGLQCLPKKTE